jgi:hypothetical protein
MKLYIAKDIKPEEIKKLFSAYYPYLRIELYKLLGNDIGKKEARAILHFANLKQDGYINIGKLVTVSELEAQFAKLGLRAEVFRRCGNVWVETSLTNNWTLEQQNTAAEEVSNHF